MNEIQNSSLVGVLDDVGGLLVPQLDLGDLEILQHGPHRLDVRAGRGGERQHAKDAARTEVNW